MESAKDRISTYIATHPTLVCGVIVALFIALIYMFVGGCTSSGRTWYGTRKSKKPDPLALDEELDELIAAINQKQRTNLTAEQ